MHSVIQTFHIPKKEKRTSRGANSSLLRHIDVLLGAKLRFDRVLKVYLKSVRSDDELNEV